MLEEDAEASAEIREFGRGLTSSRERVGKVRTAGDGVFLDGALALPSAEIGAVLYSRNGGEHILQLRDPRGLPVMDLVFAHVETATALLGPLVAKRRTRFAATVKAQPSLRTKLVMAAVAAMWIVASVLWPTGMASAALLFALAAVPLLIVLAMLTRNRLELGADGVLVTSRGRKRFVGYDAISAVEAVGATGVRLSLVDGVPLELDSAARDALLVHLRAGLRPGRTNATSSLATRIARGGRPRGAWLAEIVRLRDGASQYRDAAVRDDDLWAIVENASAPEDARAAAALLLRGADAGAARPRLRVAADAVVSQKLRIAIEACAGSDDAAAEEALAEMAEDVLAEQQMTEK